MIKSSRQINRFTSRHHDVINVFETPGSLIPRTAVAASKPVFLLPTSYLFGAHRTEYVGTISIFS